MKAPKAGEKLSEQEAKEYVDSLYKALSKYAHEKILQRRVYDPAARRHAAVAVMRQFFKNWGHFSLEVNALNAVFLLHSFTVLRAPFRFIGTVLRQDR